LFLTPANHAPTNVIDRYWLILASKEKKNGGILVQNPATQFCAVKFIDTLPLLWRLRAEGMAKWCNALISRSRILHLLRLED